MVTVRGGLTGRGQRLVDGLWAALVRPWNIRDVGAVLASIVLLDLALGYFSLPGLIDARRGPHVAEPFEEPRTAEAVLDESAHALTALLLLKAARFDGAALVLPTLAGAVFIDVDHVPMELGVDTVTRGTNRPYSHSLVMVATLLAVASLSGPRWRRPILAMTYGVGTHLLRDTATGGVPLFWPFVARRETIGYLVYATILLVSGVLVAWHGRRRT